MRLAAAFVLSTVACSNPVEKKIDSLILELDSGSPAVVDGALHALHDLGPVAGRAAPAVAKVLKQGHPGLRPPAAIVLAKINPGGAQVLPYLKEALTDADAPTRAQAARAVGMVDLPLDPATRELLHKLEKDPTGAVRAFVSWTLAVKGPPEKRYAEELRRIFQTGNGAERALAVNLLGDLFARSQDADLSFLIQALDDSALPVKKEAVVALGRQGIRGRAAIPALMRTFEHPDDELSRKALQTARILDPQGELMLPEFRRRVSHPEARVRLEAIANIGKFGDRALSARNELLSALNDPDAHVRREAARALGSLGPRAGASAGLASRFEDSSTEAGWAAAEALGRMGAEAFPFVKNLLATGKPAVRQKAVYTLGRIEPRSPEIEQLLRKCVEDADPEVSTSAKAALNMK